MDVISFGDQYYIKIYKKFKPLHIISMEHDRKKPAIYYFDDIITYEELISDSLILAEYLREKNIRQGDRVAIYLQNIPQFAIVELATWMIGGIVVPLNIMFKSKELEFYLNDAKPKVFIGLEKEIEDNLLPIKEKTGLDVIITTNSIDYLKTKIPKILENEKKTYPIGKENDFREIIKSTNKKLENVHFSKPNDPALISYTSGITGLPKGAVNTHYNIIFAANSYKEIVDLGKDDVTVAMVPLFHIGGNISFLATSLYTGIPIILMYRFDPTEALRLIEKWKGTYSANPITIYIALMNHPDFKNRDLKSFTKLGHGAMAAPAPIIDMWEKLTGVYIHNSLGMTEATSIATVVPFDEKGPIDNETNSLTVGKVLPGVELKIIDPYERKELKTNEIGEIVIRGPLIINEYWNNKEETEKTLKDGWLRTGDLGKIDENGWIFFIDRVKDMIDSSGFKIWPREIEDIIYQHPAVKEVAVVGKPDKIKGEIPKAYIVLKNEYTGKVKEDDIVSFLKNQIASYKIPREIEFVNELPKAPVGKILKRELKNK